MKYKVMIKSFVKTSRINIKIEYQIIQKRFIYILLKQLKIFQNSPIPLNQSLKFISYTNISK